MFRTVENSKKGRPQLRMLNRSASSVTLAWDDFDHTERLRFLLNLRFVECDG